MPIKSYVSVRGRSDPADQSDPTNPNDQTGHYVNLDAMSAKHQRSSGYGNILGVLPAQAAKMAALQSDVFAVYRNRFGGALRAARFEAHFGILLCRPT
ncbi:MAG: hypothetical protein ACOX87_13225 [Chloroflexota bacterium]